MIEINNLTKDYGNNRGIFDVSLTVCKGEVYGFVGINGAGKTTTIRHLMGFLKQDKGSATINDMDCWENSAEIKKLIGYVPGEIAFPDAKTGTEFLKKQADLLGITDMSYANSIIEKLQLDPTAILKRMSKGMKQKTAIVASLMADPEILIFDEPTTGLDPLMRVKFLELIHEEKRRGKTIFMSNHMFDEIEETCDKVALIQDGRIVAVKSVDEIKSNADKMYQVKFTDSEDYTRFLSEPFEVCVSDSEKFQVTIKDNARDINRLFKVLNKYDVTVFSEIQYSLDTYFKKFYMGEVANDK